MEWQTALIDFKQYLILERGFSKHSIMSYSSDVERLTAILNNPIPSPEQIDTATIQVCLYQISKSHSPRTQARMISGLRHFFSIFSS